MTRQRKADEVRRLLVMHRLERLKVHPAMTPLDSYAKRAFAFFDDIGAAKSVDEAELRMIAEFGKLGFEYLTIWTMPPAGSNLDGLIVNTRPPAYVRRYVEANHVLRDPVVTHMRANLRTSFSWSDVRATRRLTSEENAIIDEGREFGMLDGLTIPIVTARGTLAVVSPCGRDPDLSQRGRSAATMMAIMGHQAIVRLQAGKLGASEIHNHLTAREREVLQLVAFGKSDYDISDLLHISKTTVRAHIENAKRKLGAEKRLTAVILALRRREIEL